MRREYAELSKQMEYDEARQKVTMEELRAQLDVYKKHALDYQRKIKKLETSNSDLRQGLDSRHLQALEERRKELLSGGGGSSAADNKPSSASSSSGYLKRHGASAAADSPQRSTSRGRGRRSEGPRPGGAAAAGRAPHCSAAVEEKAAPSFDWLQQRIDQLVHLKLNR